MKGSDMPALNTPGTSSVLKIWNYLDIVGQQAPSIPFT